MRRNWWQWGLLAGACVSVGLLVWVVRGQVWLDWRFDAPPSPSSPEELASGEVLAVVVATVRGLAGERKEEWPYASPRETEILTNQWEISIDEVLKDDGRVGGYRRIRLPGNAMSAIIRPVPEPEIGERYLMVFGNRWDLAYDPIFGWGMLRLEGDRVAALHGDKFTPAFARDVSPDALLEQVRAALGLQSPRR